MTENKNLFLGFADRVKAVEDRIRIDNIYSEWNSINQLAAIKACVQKALSRQQSKVQDPETINKLRRDDLDDICSCAYLRVLEKLEEKDIRDRSTGDVLTIFQIIGRAAGAATKTAWRMYYQHPTAAEYITDDSGNELCLIDIYAGPDILRPAAPDAATIARDTLSDIMRYYNGDRDKAKDIIYLVSAGYNNAEIAHKLNISPARVGQIRKAVLKAAEDLAADTTKSEATREVIEKLKEHENK